MKNLNYKNKLIKKLKYRSIYSGSKESDFVLTNFANNYLENLGIKELESYEKFLTLGDMNIWNWVSDNEPLPFFEDQNYKKFILLMKGNK
tara:strand:+ start:249 stop:518 length:270 start_codon:yes stop_codon:yes gene_type:complete